jgi:hypothetical protein
MLRAPAPVENAQREVDQLLNDAPREEWAGALTRDSQSQKHWPLVEIGDSIARGAMPVGLRERRAVILCTI